MATHSSTLAWRIPWTEEPGGLQSMGLHRVRQTDTGVHVSSCHFCSSPLLECGGDAWSWSSHSGLQDRKQVLSKSPRRWGLLPSPRKLG